MIGLRVGSGLCLVFMLIILLLFVMLLYFAALAPRIRVESVSPASSYPDALSNDHMTRVPTLQPSETPSLSTSPSSLPHPRPRAWSPSSFKLDPHLNSFDTMNNFSKSCLSVVSSNLEDPTLTINDHPSTSSSRKTAGTESRAWLKF